MTQHEAQHLVAELIREHDIKDEVLVGLFLGWVKRAVWDRNGGMDTQLEERLTPDFVADFLDAAVNSLAGEIVDVRSKQN